MEEEMLKRLAIQVALFILVGSVFYFFRLVSFYQLGTETGVEVVAVEAFNDLGVYCLDADYVVSSISVEQYVYLLGKYHSFKNRGWYFQMQDGTLPNVVPLRDIKSIKGYCAPVPPVRNRA